MTEEDPNSTTGQDGLLREAAQWFMRMRGPEAEQHRPAFEAWLARGALHRPFYDRAVKTFEEGDFFKRERDRRSKEILADDEARSAANERLKRLFGAGPQRRKLTIALTFLLAASIGLLAFAWRPNPKLAGQPSTIAAQGNALRLITKPGQVLIQLLSDGSRVTLEPDTELVVDYTAARRSLRLERGTSKFEVAHELRPFVVSAGKGIIIARGTIFEVAVLPRDRVAVRLIRGKVDVAVVGRGGKAGVRHMLPGDSVLLAAQQISPASPMPFDDKSKSVAGVATVPVWREYRETPLEAAVSDANANGTTVIRLGSPDLASVKVSGRLRVDDAGKFADKVAAIFDLVVVHSDSGEIVLRRR